MRAPRSTTVPARAALGIALAAGSALCAGRATATVLEVTPGLSAGVTNNATGAASSQVPNQYEAFSSVRGSAALLMTDAGATHRLGYTFQLTGYAQSTGASNSSHDILWRSVLALSARTQLTLGANASIFRFSSIGTTDPLAGNTTSAPVGSAPTSVINGAATETLSYQPNGRIRYLQVLSAGYLRPLDQTDEVPSLLTLTATGRGERGAGQNVFTLSAVVTDFFRLDETAATPPADYQVTAQLLAGYRRELSARASFELQAGALAFYNTTYGSVALGPAGAATASYRRLPWFATLMLAHAPSVNMYAAEAVIADSATLRLSMPLNLRETLLIAGYGGYTYGRRVTGQQHFVFAPRVYDLFTVGGSLAYRFERLPFAIAIDYVATTQRGSIMDDGTNQRVYPSTVRRFLGLTVSGVLAWGEGSHGLTRP